MTTTLLLDSDIIAFKFASSAQKKFTWPNGIESIEVDELKDITPRVDEYITSLIARTRADEVIVCLSCPSKECFRKDILPTYKDNRNEAGRPVHLQAVKDYLAEAYKSFRRSGLEADDIMGILSTHPTLIPGKKIIVSEDKDMKTIPGWLFNPAKDQKARLISEEDADYYHLYQALIGDTTDHYAGCPGIGDDRATTHLSAVEGLFPVHRELTRGKNKGTIRTTYERGPADSLWEVVVSLFVSKGLTEADALIQARVARILRSSDYDFKNKEVILWNPK